MVSISSLPGVPRACAFHRARRATSAVGSLGRSSGVRAGARALVPGVQG